MIEATVSYRNLTFPKTYKNSMRLIPSNREGPSLFSLGQFKATASPLESGTVVLLKHT